MVNTLSVRKKIRDIIKRGTPFQRVSIFDCDTYFALTCEEKKFGEYYGETIRVEITAKRLKQLADDILNYLDKKAKWDEWKPTMNDLEVRLRQDRPDFGLEQWFIDWLRHAVTMKNKSDIKQARRIYEWVKSNEAWLYEVDIDEE